MSATDEPVCIRNWRTSWEAHEAKVKSQKSWRVIELDFMTAARIVCRSGLGISAQASPSHYCNLRSSFLGGAMEDEWHMDGTLPTSFEVMVFLPEGVSNLWIHHDLIPDGLDQPGGWVSIEAIEETIRRNGGWVADPEPPKPTTSNILVLRPRRLDL